MSDSISIAFLGPLGTYSHEAALYFADQLGAPDAELLECASFDEVFGAVDRGRSTYGVVAKENSLEGPVTSTLDNFAFRSSSVILAEKVFDIHHSFMVSPDADIAGIKLIASHPQGIAQCRRYLTERFPGRSTQMTASTAESARLASQDASIAAIANPLAAELYGCKIIDSSIEDNLGNQTAFALIGRLGSAPSLSSETYKTTVALFMRTDRAGTLNMILSEFAYANINLSMIQSRPLKQQLGDYMFFIEFEKKDTDPAAQTALSCLRLKLREVKVLGSYPIL
ncbi:MAG: prephenate dehydratase [Eggerthellaceae bacterium]|nr:prephenate dehydratase [Eggerthellaceae bacterium]